MVAAMKKFVAETLLPLGVLLHSARKNILCKSWYSWASIIQTPEFSIIQMKDSATFNSKHVQYLHMRFKCPRGWISVLAVWKCMFYALWLQVDRKELKLLKHPVVGSLLHYKWNKFGLIGYIVNLLTYAVFLSLLTAFALLVPNPQSPQCKRWVLVSLCNAAEAL